MSDGTLQFELEYFYGGGLDCFGSDAIIAKYVDALESRLAALEKRVPDFGPFIEVCREMPDTHFYQFSSRDEGVKDFLRMVRALYYAGRAAGDE